MDVSAAIEEVYDGVVEWAGGGSLVSERELQRVLHLAMMELLIDHGLISVVVAAVLQSIILFRLSFFYFCDDTFYIQCAGLFIISELT